MLEIQACATLPNFCFHLSVSKTHLNKTTKKEKYLSGKHRGTLTYERKKKSHITIYQCGHTPNVC
jgi:epoxyqueuosine reductase QueG